MGDAFAQQEPGKTFVYRYNTANPTTGDPLVEHAAENWMMFRGSNTGCALIIHFVLITIYIPMLRQG